jgi:hypothetical protein
VPRSTLQRAIKRLNKNRVSVEKPVKELPQLQPISSPIVADEPPTPMPDHPKAFESECARAAATVSVQNRSALGRFLPGPRITAQSERARAAVLAHPHMRIRTLAKELGLPRTTLRRVQKALMDAGAVGPPAAALPPHLATCSRSALGRFTSGPRAQPLMDRAKAALLQNKGMSASAIARMIGVSKKTVQNVRKRLNETPHSGAGPTEGTAGRS